jgi:hypothetical protein
LDVVALSAPGLVVVSVGTVVVSVWARLVAVSGVGMVVVSVGVELLDVSAGELGVVVSTFVESDGWDAAVVILMRLP